MELTFRQFLVEQKLEEEKKTKAFLEKRKELYKKWKVLINMSPAQIESFLNSQDGKKAGLSRKQASTAGTSGGK